MTTSTQCSALAALCLAVAVTGCVTAPTVTSRTVHQDVPPPAQPAALAPSTPQEFEDVIDEAPPAWIPAPANSPGLAPTFVREAQGLKAFDFSSADGRYTAQVDAMKAAAITPMDEGRMQVLIPLAPGEAIDCTFHPRRVIPAHRMVAIANSLRGEIDLRAVSYVQVSVVRGHPLSVMDTIYLTREAQPGMGEFKASVLSHPSLSIICSHDGVGYRKTYLRAVKQLARTLVDHQAEPAPEPAWAEVQVARLGPLLVGWQEARSSSEAPDTNRDVTISSFLLPSYKPDRPTSRHLYRDEIFGADTTYHAGGYSLWKDDELTDLGVEPDGEHGYRVSGKVGGKAIEGRVDVKTRWRSPRAAEFLSLLDGSVPALKLEQFTPFQPLVSTEVVIERDPARPRGVRLQAGAQMVSTSVLDALGTIESSEIPVGGATINVKRLWSQGVPR